MMEINAIFRLSNAIKQISATDKDSRAVYPLPLKFVYACSKTLKRCDDALSPVNEYKEKVAQSLANLGVEGDAKKADREAREKEARKIDTEATKQLQAMGKEHVEFEPYRFPDKWSKDDFRQIERANIPATILMELDCMGFTMEVAE